MIPKPIEDIVGDDFYALVQNRVREGLRLDFKRDLLGNSDSDKREFVRDVCAMANADGGDIVFGIDEREGEAVEFTGVGNVDLDAEILRLTEIIRSGLDPRLPSVRFKPVKTSNGISGLVARVPRSWLSPHRVLTLKDYQFYLRTGVGKHPMAIEEIRAAFGQQDILAERIIEFRDKRIGLLGSVYEPIPLAPQEAFLIVHVVPFAAVARRGKVAFNNYKIPSDIMAAAFGGHSFRHNADGFLLYTSSGMGDGTALGYIQLFNDGSAEMVYPLPKNEGKVRFPSVAIPERIIKFMDCLIAFYEEQSIQPPVVFMASITGADKVHFVTSRMFDDIPQLLRVPNLRITDCLISDFEVPSFISLRPFFDHLWQAFGFANCPHYDAEGRWAVRR